MVKLSYGVPTKHVLKSQGGDTDLMKFYCTQNSTTYGQKWSKFQPRPGKHTGTGYLSNFRPGVYYTERLDQLDNPAMGKIIKGNYESITQKHFKPYRTPDGSEVLPSKCTQAATGFVRQKAVTIPTVNEVSRVAIDTRIASAPIDVRPRHKPYLHKLHSKDPVELENNGYGPGYMTTESGQKFKGEPTPSHLLTYKAVGENEESGFTHNKNREPITFHPDYAHKADAPSYLTDRPTGVTVMKTSYLPSRFSNGAEPFPRIANRSVRDTGFTTGTSAQPAFLNSKLGDAYDKADDIPDAVLDKMRRRDPTEYMNATHPNNHSSVSTNFYRGKRQADPSEADRLGRTAVGWKEDTGFSTNNDRFVQQADNPARFITHYDTRFLDRTARGLDRAGHTWGGVQPHKPDGFTRSEGVHTGTLGQEGDTTATLRRLEPYVARSLRARDVFFDDHTYDRKLHVTQQTSTTADYVVPRRSVTTVF